MADARDRQRHFLGDAGWLPLALAAKRPPWGTIYRWFAKFRDDGLLEKINHSLVMADRERVGREASPSGHGIPHWTRSLTCCAYPDVKMLRTEAGGPRGYDAGKKIKGRKRHALVDTDGRGLVLEAHPASIQDRDGGGPLLCASRGSFPFIEKVFADSGYAGEKVATATVIAVEIVRKSPDQVGFAVQPRRWVVERFFAWINRNRPLAKDFEATIALGPRLPLRRLRHAPRPQIGPNRMTFETDSKRLLPCTVQPLGARNSVIEDRALVAAAVIRENIELNGDLSERAVVLGGMVRHQVTHHLLPRLELFLMPLAVILARLRPDERVLDAAAEAAVRVSCPDVLRRGKHLLESIH